jgi:DNA-directed RNA polymerase subunit E'/Rpb7
MLNITNVTTDPLEAEMDFAALLEKSFAEEQQPMRGDIVMGIVLSIDNMGLLVDLRMKRDGVVPRNDLEKLGYEPNFSVGDEVPVMIVRTEDEDGNMIVSVSQAKQNEDWILAEDLMNKEEIWEGFVADANRGGLIVPFGNLRGFVPASHVIDLPRGLNEDERKIPDQDDRPAGRGQGDRGQPPPPPPGAQPARSPARKARRQQGCAAREPSRRRGPARACQRSARLRRICRSGRG